MFGCANCKEKQKIIDTLIANQNSLLDRIMALSSDVALSSFKVSQEELKQDPESLKQQFQQQQDVNIALGEDTYVEDKDNDGVYQRI